MNLHLEAFYCSFIFNNIGAAIKDTPFIKKSAYVGFLI